MWHSWLATTMEVYMQSLQREVRTAINSIHDELVATGTETPDPQTPEARSPERLNRAVSERASGQKRSFVAQKKQNTTEGGEKRTVAPSRGKILQFAGKMRANGLGGVPLSS
jgi:hypothetical protein